MFILLLIRNVISLNPHTQPTCFTLLVIVSYLMKFTSLIIIFLFVTVKLL